jgi:hypothetical protein
MTNTTEELVISNPSAAQANSVRDVFELHHYPEGETMEVKKIVLLVLLLLGLPARGAAQTAQEVNEANNHHQPP